jgi:hypothetical protein
MTHHSFGFTFVYPVIPYVRMTQRGKYVSSRAQKYLNSQVAIKEYMRERVGELESKGLDLFPYIVEEKLGNLTAEVEYWFPVPPRASFTVEINFLYHPEKEHHYCDIDNMIKAMMDAGNMILYVDDRWCDGISATRDHADMIFCKDKKTIQVEMEIAWL